jgi:hypothetical protein
VTFELNKSIGGVLVRRGAQVVGGRSQRRECALIKGITMKCDVDKMCVEAEEQ